MDAVRGKVVGGRLVVDEPTDLPEGTELYLLPVDEAEEDRLDVEEATTVLETMNASGEKQIPLEQVKAELAALFAEMDAGEGIPTTPEEFARMVDASAARLSQS